MLRYAIVNPLEVVDTWVIVALFVLIIGLFALIVFLFKWNRKRIRRIHEEGIPAPPERAENDVRRAEGIESMLSSQGYDTTEAQGHLRMAKAFLSEGNRTGAMSEAALAKKILMEIKTKRVRPAPKTVDILSMPETAGEEEKDIEEMGFNINKELREKVPAMYLEAKFALSTAHDLIITMESGSERDTAEDALAKARLSFDSKQYQEAFSLACRARRLAGVSGIKLSEENDYCPLEKENGPDEEASGTTTEPEDTDVTGEVLEEVAVDIVVMECPGCQHPYAEGDRFCSKCGERLTLICSGCQTKAEPGDRFCSNCGAKLP